MSIVLIIVTAAVAFIASAAYYSLLAGALARAKPSAGPVKSMQLVVGVELLRSLTVAAAITVLLGSIAPTSVASAILTASALWVAFPVVLLAGSVVHEDVPVRLAAIHAGDWLLKLIVIATVAQIWRS